MNIHTCNFIGLTINMCSSSTRVIIGDWGLVCKYSAAFQIGELCNKRDREEGQREEGQREEGQREEGQREEGQREEGQREEGQREEGQREEGQREEGQREEGQRAEGGGQREEGWREGKMRTFPLPICPPSIPGMGHGCCSLCGFEAYVWCFKWLQMLYLKCHCYPGTYTCTCACTGTGTCICVNHCVQST